MEKEALKIDSAKLWEEQDYGAKISATTAKNLLDAKIIAVEKRKKEWEEKQKKIEDVIDEGKKQQEWEERQNEIL